MTKDVEGRKDGRDVEVKCQFGEITEPRIASHHYYKILIVRDRFGEYKRESERQRRGGGGDRSVRPSTSLSPLISRFVRQMCPSSHRTKEGRKEDQQQPK